MPEEKKKKDQMLCQCSMNGCGCGFRSHGILRIVRAIFVLALLVIVFTLGLKMGELRGILESQYNDRMSAYPTNYPTYAGYPMMPGTPTSTR